MTQHDVLIVGGGLIGCASAYYLSEKGARVALLERAELNSGASGRNAGSLHFQLEHRLIRDSAKRATEIAQILPLTLAAIEDWQSLETELGATLEVTMDGGLMVAETPLDLEALEFKQSLERQRGLETKLLTQSEIVETCPHFSDRVTHATLCYEEGRANPRLVTAAFASAAMRNGATFYTNTTAKRFRSVGGDWQVSATSKPDSTCLELSASAILNAGGAWMQPIAKMANIELPMVGLPLIMNVTTRASPFLPCLIQHVSRDLSMKQVSDGNLLIGGGWSAKLGSHANGMQNNEAPQIIPENVIENLRVAAQLVPHVRKLDLLRTWTGIAGVTPDELPYLGETWPGNRFFAVGGGSAFTLGPTLARIAASIILGDSVNMELSAFDPGRFSTPLSAEQGR